MKHDHPKIANDKLLERLTRCAESQVTLLIANIALASVLENCLEIPDNVVDAARKNLLTQQESGELLRDCRVLPLGPDLLVHATAHGATPVGEILRRIHEATSCALQEAERNGILSPVGKDLLSQQEANCWRVLNLRSIRVPYTERGAEAIFVSKLVDGAPGGFNRMLFNLFFHPDKGSHQRLDGTRFVAVVEHLPALAADPPLERRVFLFGDRPEEDTLALLYPLSDGPLLVSRDQVGDIPELLSLIANPVEWAVSAVYAVRGRFVHDGEQWQMTRHEPVAAVTLLGADPRVGAVRPVCVLRLQSGLPAVGEAQANFGGEPVISVGGSNNGYHVAVTPVTLPEARPVTASPGLCRLVAYSYQSYDHGRIPPDHDFVDVFAQDPVETRWLQGRAMELARCLTEHGEFQPFVVAEEAERRAKQQREELDAYFEAIPATESGQPDPIVEHCCSRTGKYTLTDIKADAGGKLGHTAPPTVFLAVAKASLLEAQEQGLVLDSRAFAVGDDLHLLMTHTRGVDANEIHLLAFQTFWRAVWVTQALKYKPYGLAQDLKIGPATKGRAVEELAQPTKRFLTLLQEFLPAPERACLGALEAALGRWQSGLSTAQIQKPFAGNVTGQGPGFAEIPVGSEKEFALVAADKAGPAAFNLPVFRAAQEAIQDPWFQSRFGRSIAFEIFDVHEHRRVFLDAQTHAPMIQRLLGATNLFNVKRLWTLAEPVADPQRVRDSLGSVLLAASTEKLAIIAGGEYVGKDDPVLLGVRALIEPIFRLMRDGFYLTQGDERGSHYMMLLPKPLPEAVATIRSRGLEVGLRVSLGSNGKLFLHDVYAEAPFVRARQRIQELNFLLWTCQGSEFTPVGVGAHDVEPAYPLMKVLARITGPDSSYAIRVPPRAVEP